MRSTKRTLL